MDKDPAIPSFTSFSALEVAAALTVKEKYERLLAAEDLLPLSPVTEEELNAAIPVSRTVTLEPGPDPQAELARLQQLGGNPRLVTPVPAWLQPHLLAAKCKEDSCEMPTKEEITNFLAKKNSGRGKKRGAGWDIVVDWVPAPQPAAKRSKLEKQLRQRTELLAAGGAYDEQLAAKLLQQTREAEQHEREVEAADAALLVAFVTQ